MEPYLLRDLTVVSVRCKRILAGWLNRQCNDWRRIGRSCRRMCSRVTPDIQVF